MTSSGHVDARNVRASAHHGAHEHPATPVTHWDRRRVRVASTIERAALELFAEHGAENVTVQQIATAARISDRTFFRYFASRDDVLSALPSRLNDRLCVRVLEQPLDLPIMDAFRAALRLDEVEGEERELMLLWGRVMSHASNRNTAAFERSTVGMSAAFEQVIVARSQPRRDDDLRPGATAAALAGVMTFAFRRWVHSGANVSFNALVDECFGALTDLR